VFSSKVSNVFLAGSLSLRLPGQEVRFSQFVLINRSLGLNYEEEQICHTAHGFISFTPNRVWHSDAFSVLCVLSIFYPPEQTFGRFEMVCGLLARIAHCPSLCRGEVVFLVFGVGTDLFRFVSRRREFTPMTCLSTPQTCLWLTDLDFGYKVFSANFSSPNGVRLFNVILTNARQSIWKDSWLRARHITPVGNLSFRGYYAAAFSYLISLPFRLRLLDYFDFFARLDLDADVRHEFRTIEHDLFPLSEMIARRAYLFGCRPSLDNPGVSVNVTLMTLSYLRSLERRCGGPQVSHSIAIGFLWSGRQAMPGLFQQFWLGFFSSPEVKGFTRYYLSFPGGYLVHRWGDQQYYFRTHALFGINASGTFIADRHPAGCRFAHNPGHGKLALLKGP
jgi:hypothetical protein